MQSRFFRLWSAAVLTAVLGVVPLSAEVVAATVKTPPPPQTGYFKLGSHTNPAGQVISVNSRSLLFDGKPWFPVMGEFHYARVPASEWRTELMKVKAGGVDIVSTYVFWIYHEEIQGQWDWSGRRNLRKFLQTCHQVGLKVLLRCGPWCHGEVRNGGFPDWVVAHKDWKLRSTDPHFLAAVKVLYDQIAKQVRGELWKDGGPVIGIQVDNEYHGSPNYLMALKRMAIKAGIDVPLYTKTGWPAMRKPVPLGQLLPFFGAYADGFWDRSLKPMPGKSWETFTFKHTRTDTGVGNDELGNRKAGDTPGTDLYPYLTCEIGGGMETSYHRRINDKPADVEAVALCQLGSGSCLMGYYMYHGGQNPNGKLTTLQESLATGYPNDLPVKNYDFKAPIGEYGQLNPQYFWLRRLHLFLHDFGSSLATMPLNLPEKLPANKHDLTTLRWSVRSDGHSGYVFVNNYQRLTPMPAKTNVQFKLDLPAGPLVFPRDPVTIPDGDFFFWPFNMNLHGARLIYATAQPVCKIDSGNVHTYFYAKTPGIKAQFAFDPKTLAKGTEMPPVITVPETSRQPAISVQSKSGAKIKIVVLSRADSLALEKVSAGQVAFESKPKLTFLKVHAKLLRKAGPARNVPISKGRWHIAMAPSDADFTNAAVWQITLPKHVDWKKNPLLRIRYLGDVARFTLNGKLIDDNFYSGRPFDLGLRRYAPGIFHGDLRLEILPLRKDAPIYLEPRARPRFGTNVSVLKLQSAKIIESPSWRY